ncbi:hypothetical protein AB3R30_15155 [Leptolyngbyaceae cyanobacterium UHCC 1019]
MTSLATSMLRSLLKRLVIPKALYETVRQRAQSWCEYCHYPELLSSALLSIDYIQLQSLSKSCLGLSSLQ